MTNKIKKLDFISVAMYVYCLLIFGYVLYRALHVPFTFDEVTTSQIASGDEWANFGATANNHFLNLILIKVNLIFFNPSELAYRLPNVLGFILYLVYAVKMGRLIKPSAPYLVLILLTSMPFVLDFFGLARGYGLSLSFMLPSIYYLLKYAEVNKIQFGIASLIFGILAVLSNLTSFNYLLPSLIILFALTLLSREKIIAKLFSMGVIVAVFFYYIIPVAFQLKEQGELYFGGRKSFYHDTVLSLSRTFAYFKLNISFVNVVFAILFFTAILFSIINIYRAIRKRAIDMKIILPILFFLSILAPVSQHIIFETSFPTERTGLIYYPILILVLLNGINGSTIRIQNGFFKIIALAFAAHLIFSANFTHTYSWRFDSGSKEVISILKKKSEQKEYDKPITLGVDYIYTPTLWFYKSIYSFDNISPQEVVKCWEFEMPIEELDPKYYGTSIVRKEHLSAEDAETIASTNFDFYYLNDFVVQELIRLGYTVEMIKHFEIANSSLISLRKS